MKSVLITVASLACLAAVPTVAFAGQKVDMAQLTCKDFLADQEGIMPTIFWIDGYLSKSTGNTEIDPEQMTQNVKDVAAKCSESPDQKVLDLFE